VGWENRETSDWKKETSVHPWRKTEGLGAQFLSIKILRETRAQKRTRAHRRQLYTPKGDKLKTC
jgi:hypothetical protein